MRSTALSLSLLAASALAAPIAPIGRPRANKRQAAASTGVGAQAFGFVTVSGAPGSIDPTQIAEATAKVPEITASSGGVLGVSGSSTSSSSGASETGSSGSSSNSGSGSSSSSSSSNSTSSGDSGSGSSSSSSSGDSGSGSSSSSSGGNAQDLTVLQFALTLEQLETSFYQKGLAQFDKAAIVKQGLSSTQADIVLQTFQEQANDEQTHVDFLKSAINSLGAQPLDKCSFDFSSVLSNPATFISAARTIELVGVSAYAGGANLISNPSVLTDAATILSIESRHQSALNVFSGGTFAAQPFDIALTPESVLSLVSGFLQGCSAKDLGLSANQPLSAINAKTGNTLISGNTILAFESPVLNANTDASQLTCQMIVGGQAQAIVQPISHCQVPGNLNGPAMVFISNSKNPLPADVTKQDQKQIVAGPAALFIDDGQETFQQIFDIRGFGISAIASLDTGSISIQKQTVTKTTTVTKTVKVVNIISESNPNSRYDGPPIRNGMIYGNQKRGFESFAGGRIVGWERD